MDSNNFSGIFNLSRSCRAYRDRDSLLPAFFRPIIGKIKDPEAEEKKERAEKAEADKEFHWIYYFMAIVSITIGLWRYKMINEAMFSAIMLPAMFGSWFIIRFRHKAERTGIRFRDILLHPWQNFSLFLFFCAMVIICILFIVPMLISAYGGY